MLTEVGLLRNAIERYPHKPSPVNTPSGCRFRTRCQFARERWDAEEPKAPFLRPRHMAACHFPLQSPDGANVDSPAYDRHRRGAPIALALRPE